MTIAQKLMIAVGIGLVVGLTFGWLMTQERYYIATSENPPHEISKELYEYVRKENDGDRGYKQAVFMKYIYDVRSSIVIGLIVFGLLLIILGSFPEKRVSLQPGISDSDELV